MPTASLQGLDQHQRTLYIGTFSKTLFPGLRLGFIIVPPSLIIPMVAAKQLQDGCTATAVAGDAVCLFTIGWLYRAFKKHAPAVQSPPGHFICRGQSIPRGVDTAAFAARGVTAGLPAGRRGNRAPGWWPPVPEQGIRLYGLADFYTDTPPGRAHWCWVLPPIRRVKSCNLSNDWHRYLPPCLCRRTAKIGLPAVIDWSVLCAWPPVYSALIQHTLCNWSDNEFNRSGSTNTPEFTMTIGRSGWLYGKAICISIVQR
ncbi:HTH-type transcriptional regulatory protein gabR [Serratia odorifera]|uniref:HTH-type transcriptional regulatory protein gabR n=1 Tax=Serratia odorifera TaxID=618 RepID=A0A447L0L2_SEROD|nr:HTH-type transcriptional regulatory protein gabR [Serratia odorifera]